jgi:hypothetical protein
MHAAYTAANVMKRPGDLHSYLFKDACFALELFSPGGHIIITKVHGEKIKFVYSSYGSTRPIL